MTNQEDVLCNLADNQNVRAVLRNEFLEHCQVQFFIFDLVSYSTTDKGQAVSILLQDERCHVDVAYLHDTLKKDSTAMAAALIQDERLQKDIQASVPNMF
jgi:hypothetical protein